MSCNGSGCCPEPIYSGCPDPSHPLTVFPYGGIYNATLDLAFPNKWEFGWLTNTVVLAHDSSLTWISDEFTYNGETCIATLVITGVGSGESTVTIETTSVYLGNVVYKNEASPFENLGPNRMVVHGSSTWTPANGAYIACLFPYEALLNCENCVDGNISGFEINGGFGRQIFYVEDMLTVALSSNPCVDFGDGVFTWRPDPEQGCQFYRRWCSGGSYSDQISVEMSGGGASAPVIRVDELISSVNTAYRYTGPTVGVIDCLDDSVEYTLSQFQPTGSGSITMRFLRV